MVVMKLLGILLTIATSSLIGIYYSKKIEFRLEDLRQMKRALVLLRGEIKYSISTLPEAAESTACRCNQSFKYFYEILSKELKKFDGQNFQMIWESSVEKSLKNTYLIRSDIIRFKQLGATLGYLDKETQLNTINLYLEQLDEDIKYLIQHNEQNQKLYRNLGVLGGLLIVILFI